MEVCLCVSQRISILNNSTDKNYNEFLYWFCFKAFWPWNRIKCYIAIITIPVLSSSVTDWLYWHMTYHVWVGKISFEAFLKNLCIVFSWILLRMGAAAFLLANSPKHCPLVFVVWTKRYSNFQYSAFIFTK